jgi:hydroxymethylglutaryl-CoA lyase
MIGSLVTARRERISICESWARDGIQSWPGCVPSAEKVAVLKASLAAGFTELDVTSFVPPATSAQFADALTVLESLADRPPGTLLRVLVVNQRSFDSIARSERAADIIDVCGFPFSASEAHNLANLHKTHEAHRADVVAMVRRTHDIDAEPLLGIATAFGCPLTGAVSSASVLALVDWAVDIGIRRVMLGDTTGTADPIHAFELCAEVLQRYPGVQVTGHFHDTRGSGIANTLAAIAAGVRSVDASYGGCGGEPPSVQQGHSGISGNVCTEDLAALLQRMGFDTGLDVEQVLRVGRSVEAIAGAALHSQVLRTGVAAPRADDD